MTVQIATTNWTVIPNDPWQSDLEWYHRQSHESYPLRGKASLNQLQTSHTVRSGKCNLYRHIHTDTHRQRDRKGGRMVNAKINGVNVRLNNFA